jgi:hypothetical protein
MADLPTLAPQTVLDNVSYGTLENVILKYRTDFKKNKAIPVTGRGGL